MSPSVGFIILLKISIEGREMENVLAVSDFSALCGNDSEFMLAAYHWTGGLRLIMENDLLFITMKDGQPFIGDPGDVEGVLTLKGPEYVWKALLAPLPPRFLNDIQPAKLMGLEIAGNDVLLTQYYAAVMRAIELLRPASPKISLPANESKKTGLMDAVVGRYIYLDILGQDYRVYFEEVGQGIPLLLQHTAGLHGTQWRHLMENTDITDHFRLIAYDLPFQGKSIPPVGPKWWTEEYKLTADFVRAMPIELSKALELDKPVFMGDSVDEVQALDLNDYITEFDLKKEANNIESSKMDAHILSDEHDCSTTMELGKQPHKAFKGSSWTGMGDVGYFPMPENPINALST